MVLNKSIPPTFNHVHEQERRQYAEKVREIKRGTFTPLVFASTGGIAGVYHLFKRSANILIDKKQILFADYVID